MKKIILAAIVLAVFSGAAFAGGGLNGFLHDLNIQAHADLNSYTARLSTQFGVPEVRVRAVIGMVREPADAFMCLQLGQWTQNPLEQVVHVYKANQGKGWGVIAKSLGIKPGSAEFHALKNGELTFTGNPEQVQGHGKGKGKGKEHNK